MKTLLSTSLLISILALAWIGCKDKHTDPAEVDYLAMADCTGILVDDNTYTKSIKPIMTTHCSTAGCHDVATKAGDHDLTNYTETRFAFEVHEALCCCHHGDGCPPMPNKGTKLSQDLINKLDCWAKNGYKE